MERITFKHTERTIVTRSGTGEGTGACVTRAMLLTQGSWRNMECVGSPVFGQDGNVMGAISVSSLYKPTEDYDALGCRVRTKAAEISKLLGFLGKC